MRGVFNDQGCARRWLTLGCIFLATFAPQVRGAQRGAEQQALIARFWTAFKAQQHGQHAEAERIYLEVLKDAPLMSDAWHLGGVAKHQQGRSREALPMIEHAVKLRPVFTTGYNNLGNVYFKMGRLEQAMDAFEIAISQNATNTNARVGLGEALIAAGRYQDAENVGRAAVAADPKYYGAYGLLAQTLRENGNPDESLKVFEAMIAMNPATVTGYSNMGTLLHKKKRYQEAEDALNTAIRLNPNHQNSYYNLGLVLHAQSDLKYVEALQAGASCVAIDPSFAQPWYNIGRLFRELGRHYDSIAALHRYQQLTVRNLRIRGKAAFSLPKEWAVPAACSDPSAPDKANEVRLVRYWESESDVKMEQVNWDAGPPAVYGTSNPSSLGGARVGSGYVNNGPSAELEELPLASTRRWNSLWYVDRELLLFEMRNVVVEGEMGLMHDGRCRVFLPLHDTYVPVLDQIMPIAIPTKIYGTVLTFPQVAARNYYHWVVEGLSRLMIAWERVKNDSSVLLMVPSNPSRKKTNARQPFILQYLDLLGFSSDRIVLYDGEKTRYAAERLLYADWRNQASRPGMHFCAPRSALLAVRRSLAPHHLPLPSRPYLVLISRADTKHRTLLNEDKLAVRLEEVAKRYGKTFQLFIGEAFSIKETVLLFRDACICISPHGAGLANIVWMGNGSSVLEMPVHETHGRDMAHLAQSVGLDYWTTSGVKPFRFLADFTADIDEVERIAEQILKQQSAPLKQQIAPKHSH